VTLCGDVQPRGIPHYIYIYIYGFTTTKNFKYLGCENSYKNEKVVLQTLEKFAQRNPEKHFKQTLVQKLSRMKLVHIKRWQSHLFYMEAKYGPLEKIIKSVDIS